MYRRKPSIREREDAPCALIALLPSGARRSLSHMGIFHPVCTCTGVAA
ncbi:hypothetical protein SXCC_01131 [Gluconacetobacter sp. SXCC-1]|nr:hypothetical protein SXCC_01131 [Gluconacetobacter sp. SXCC-1]